MRRSKTLSRIRNGEAVRLACLGHYIPAYVAHAARAGYDCIWVDLEHRKMQSREVDALLAFGHLYDVDIMIRPPTLEKTGLCRYLEDGAAGLMIPHVSDVNLAKQLVQFTKFPPLGNRGIDNAGLDADFLLHDPDEYAAWCNRETFLVAQIETPEAVYNIDPIVSAEGVDLVFIGPGDLGLRLRQTNEMTLDEAWERVASACKSHGKAFGGPVASPQEMKQRRNQGAQFLLGTSEFAAWSSSLVADIQIYNEID